MTTFTNAEAALDLSQIREIEKYSKLKFPEEYVTHLLEFNGGQCSPNRFGFEENGEMTESEVDWFLAIYDGHGDNLKDYIDTYKIEEKRLPQRILPIANDPGGNLICISCEGRDTGYVYFWDHEKEVDYNEFKDDYAPNMYLIAENFTQFIKELK